jgi:hypothetical protein
VDAVEGGAVGLSETPGPVVGRRVGVDGVHPCDGVVAGVVVVDGVVVGRIGAVGVVLVGRRTWGMVIKYRGGEPRE